MRNPSETDSRFVPLAAVERSGKVESVHHGHVVIVKNDTVWRSWGDPDVPVFTRSAIKPLQALAVHEAGIPQKLGCDARELAAMSASHNGTPHHVEVVQGLLKKAGFEEEDLQCGAHAPFDKPSSIAIAREGGKPQKIHNNCSGKHAGFLALARALGASPKSYLDPKSPGQQKILSVVAEMADISPEDIDVGIDGCGAPTLRMPLSALAKAFFRVANPDRLSSVRSAGCRMLMDAVNLEPVTLAGEGRLCTALLRSTPGRFYPKNGAEGVYAIGVCGSDGEGLGIAIKVSCGHERGYIPVVVDLLQRLGVWDEVPPTLADFHEMPVYNTQKLLVGAVRSVLPS